MYTIKNQNNFPLVVNLTKDRSIHLAPLAEDLVEDKDFDSPDLQSKIKRKMIMVTSKPVVKVAPATSSKPKIKKEEVTANVT